MQWGVNQHAIEGGINMQSGFNQHAIGIGGHPRKHTLSSSGRKCIEESKNRNDVWETVHWYAVAVGKFGVQSKTASCAGMQRKAIATSAPGMSGLPWRMCKMHRIVSASARERSTKYRPPSSRRYAPDVRT